MKLRAFEEPPKYILCIKLSELFNVLLMSKKYRKYILYMFFPENLKFYLNF